LTAISFETKKRLGELRLPAAKNITVLTAMKIKEIIATEIGEDCTKSEACM